jgi:type I restriction enzyme S subunit
MKTISVKNNWLKKSDLRLDASFHLSDGVFANYIIKNSRVKYDILQNLTEDIFMGPRFKRYYVSNPEKGVPFMGGSDMQKSSLSELKLISKKMTKEIQQLYLKRGWILVTRSGTIGKSVLTNEEFEGKTATEDVIRIIPNSKKLTTGYLYAFLSSKYGFALLTQGTYGAVIQHIEPQHIKDLPIPILPEEEQHQIHDLIIESSKLRVEAIKSLNLAHSYFEKYFTNQLSNRKINTVKLDSIKSFQSRIDASYNIRFNEYCNSIKSSGLEFKKLSEYIDKIFIPNRGRRNYVDTGLQYLSTSDISTSNPISIKKYISIKTPGLESLKVEKDWIIIARSGQEILGSVFYVTEKLRRCGINEHGLRLILKEIAPEYVFCFLSTSFGKQYLRSGIFGSAVLTINNDFIKNLLIPILDKEELKQVVDTTKLYIKDYDLAISKENQAIELIENEISSWQK